MEGRYLRMLSRRVLFLGRNNSSNRRVVRLQKVLLLNHLTDDGNSDDEMFLSHAEPAPNGNKILSFSGDAEDEEEDGDHDHDHDPAVDLFAEASKPDVEGEEEAGEGADEAEPEDDFNAAWEVLDLARAIYEKQMDGNDEMRLKVADTFIMLGDISLETGSSCPSFFLFLPSTCRN
jgi:HAT1-interacting factor 1